MANHLRRVRDSASSWDEEPSAKRSSSMLAATAFCSASSASESTPLKPSRKTRCQRNISKGGEAPSLMNWNDDDDLDDVFLPAADGVAQGLPRPPTPYPPRKEMSHEAASLDWYHPSALSLPSVCSTSSNGASLQTPPSPNSLIIDRQVFLNNLSFYLPRSFKAMSTYLDEASDPQQHVDTMYSQQI